MSEFVLDTSGAVEMRPAEPDRVAWPDLNPFTQGYVEAALAAMFAEAQSRVSGPVCVWHPAFSDLAPSTLAAILKDCEAFERLYGPHTAEPRIYGRVFWEKRQAGDFDQEPFPPLTPSLGDDGKVYLRAAK